MDFGAIFYTHRQASSPPLHFTRSVIITASKCIPGEVGQLLPVVFQRSPRHERPSLPSQTTIVQLAGINTACNILAKLALKIEKEYGHACYAKMQAHHGTVVLWCRLAC